MDGCGVDLDGMDEWEVEAGSGKGLLHLRCKNHSIME